LKRLINEGTSFPEGLTSSSSTKATEEGLTEEEDLKKIILK